MLRVASAAVLAPIALAVAYVGGWLFLALCAIAAGGILWEWTSPRRRSGRSARSRARIGGITGGGRADRAERPGAAFGTVAIGAVLAGLVGCLAARDARLGIGRLGRGRRGLCRGGAACAGAAAQRSAMGFPALLFLFAIVWATDIFAYFCGRAIGGPLLWPRVSPKKTWAGAIGGLAGGVAAGVAVAYASGLGKLGIAAVMALVLSVLAQAGDLFESAVKRHFGAKDASRLIPGHGGVMDRLDGFLVAALAALLIGMAHQGMAAPARGLLIW